MKTQLRFAAFAAAAAGALILGGCPFSITSATFAQVSDKTPPVADISSPADNSTYTQTVTVNGTAIDNGGRLKKLAWTVTGALGVLATGTVDPSAIGGNGSYTFQFSTLNFSGPIAINVAATDLNDNVGQSARTLAAPTSALSSFTASTANKSVTLNWETISGATYTLIYTNNGTIPSLNYGTQVSVGAPPYALAGLSNGSMHVFLLRAQVGANTFWSDYVRAIPLSSFTLAPMVTGAYHAINLEWYAIAAINQFQVDRAFSPQGPWTNYTGTITGTSYTDTTVSDNTWYYYRVTPALSGATTSTFNGAQTLHVPPSATSAITGLTLAGAANKTRVYGNYAFVAADSAGVLVIDVSNPKAPVQVASVPTVKAMDICLDPSGLHAYVADATGGLQVFDISNPLSPAAVGQVGTGGTYTKAIAVSEIDAGAKKIAYVLSVNPLNNQTAVFVVDVTTAASPSLQAYSYAPGSTYVFTDIAAMYYSGSARYVYAASGGTANGELVLLSDNGTNNLSVLVSYNDASGTAYKANEVYVKPATTVTDFVYVIGQAKAFLEPPPPYVVRVFNLGLGAPVGTSGVKNGYVQDIIAKGNTVYAADGIGLQLVDVTTPSAPTLGAFWNTPGIASGVDTQPGSTPTFAVMADGAIGFHTVDLTQPVSPTIAGKQVGNAVYGVAVRGGYAYLSETPSGGSSKFQILDVTNPLAMVAHGSYTTGGLSSGGIALSGNYAFMADGGNGLRVVDITNPDLLAFVSLAPPITSSTASRIAIKGDYAYVAAGGLEIYDISNPAAPFAVGFAESDGGGIWDVALRGQLAYVVDGAYFQPNSLKVLDVSNPASPVQVGKSATGMIVSSVSLYGDYAFVGDSGPSMGLRAFNINPSSGSYMTAYGPSGSSGCFFSGVAAYGNWAFVAAEASSTTPGLAVIDISSPSTLANSNLRATTTLSGNLKNAQYIVLSGSYAFVCDGDTTLSSGGLVVARIAP